MQQPEASNATSLSLIDQARHRDPDAWRRLCQIYAPLVYSWVRKSGVPENDAADVVQETFRIVSVHLERFRHDRPDDTFRGWLITITRTEVLGYFRRRGKQLAVGEGGSSAMLRMQNAPEGNAVDADSQGWQDESTEAEIMRRAAELVRQDFEPHTWQAFWRSVVEGHDVADIAADLHMTPNAIRQAKFRILTRLRETLGEW
ncbi:MAG: sigma-70 family polymerase sigma factor [Planctomycetaceae bacterium]|nr:sigma-70 family polymerase sigma factor [Planctomycetaceae bacterium]